MGKPLQLQKQTPSNRMSGRGSQRDHPANTVQKKGHQDDTLRKQHISTAQCV
jgi:hypothetical protein